jgi:cytochrome c peroxidase
MNYLKHICFLISCAIILSSCAKDESIKVTPVTEFKGFEKPTNFPNPLYRFQYNKVTKDGFELGRKLFYDGILSRDGSISCGSCHQQIAAFAHFDHPVSHGIDDRLGTRNSPVLQNLAWSPSFFWDGGVFDLDLFSFAPIQNPVEMDEDIQNVLSKLKMHPTYPGLFKKAFGTDSITSTNFMYALSQFMNMLVSNNSRYDKYIAGDASALSITEIEGLNLFMQNCNRCHTAPLFTDNKFHNNGIARLADKGRYEITLVDSDLYKFKTPSLRNIEKSIPYFHDGRTNTLEQVLNHYTSNIQSTGTVDEGLKGGIALSADDKTKIIAFLKTLTDDTFLKDTRFSEQ